MREIAPAVCGKRRSAGAKFPRGRLATHLVSVASSPGFFASRALPDHSSGANGLVSGAMKMLSLYFGTDKLTFTVTGANTNANPNSRTYTNGRPVGKSVARWVFNHALRPLKKHSHDHDDHDQDND